MLRRVTGAMTIISLSLGFSLQVAADISAEDAAQYRQSIMKSQGGHVAAISMIVRGKAGDPRFVSKHAEALANLAAEVGTVFQAGSNIGDSQALPAIWEEPEAFAEAVAKIEAATAELRDVAAGGDLEAIGEAFRDVGQACKDCHDRFRKEHEH